MSKSEFIFGADEDEGKQNLQYNTI